MTGVGSWSRQPEDSQELVFIFPNESASAIKTGHLAVQEVRQTPMPSSVGRRWQQMPQMLPFKVRDKDIDVGIHLTKERTIRFAQWPMA
jgi:hypothetical protein